MKIDVYAFSRNGVLLCGKIKHGLAADETKVYVPEKYSLLMRDLNVIDDLHQSVKQSFEKKDAVIFVCAAGIAVRAIAPFVKSKFNDPAVICMDEKGKNVISLLSGHMGGANKLSKKIAEITNGQPIITTATDINGKIAVDEWAADKNMSILNMRNAKLFAAEILENNTVGLTSDFPIIGNVPEEIDQYNKKNYETGICISLDENKKPYTNTLNLIPRIVSVGVGCRKGADFQTIIKSIKEVLMGNGISCLAVKSINSIDLKKHEEGIIMAAEFLNVPFNTYSKFQLNTQEGSYTESDFVKKITGVDNVCERSAFMGSDGNKLIINKTIKNSVTVAACMDDYSVNFNYRLEQ
jgi:cobalt-precorrin 5A hydrolase